MIRRQRPMRRRKTRAVQVRQLLGMKLDRQPKGAGLGEQGAQLLDRKGDPLAEGIHRIDQPLGMGLPQGRQRDLCDIGGRAALVVGRHGMGGKMGCPDRDWPRLTDPACDAQHLQLVLDGQAIAGFHLDRRGPAGDQLIDPGQGKGQKVVLGCRPCRHDGRKYPAAGAGDVLIACPLQPQLELNRTVAGKDRMSVAVDQARRHQPPAAIMFGQRAIFGRQIGHRPRPDDPVADDRHGGIGDQAVAICHRRKGGVGQKHRLALCVMQRLICLDIMQVK